MTGNDPLSTTTEESSGLVNTNEPQDKKILIIHIVAGVGISTIALIGIVVACIGLVGIMKCMQARSAKGRQSDTEQPQLVISSSNGILLQENTAYRKSMNGWSTDTTGYETLSTEGGRNPDTENISKSDEMVGYETMSTKEQSKPDSTQPQDSSDSSGIVMQENTAYKKSTKSGDRQNKDANTNQCTNSSGIAVHKNTAYKKSTNSGGTVTGYETMDEIVEEVMQLNQAYGFQGESQEGINSINTGDYETMTGDSAYDYGSQAHRGVDKKSTMAMAQPVTYDVLIQQQNIIPEDGEHSYDYVI